MEPAVWFGVLIASATISGFLWGVQLRGIAVLLGLASALVLVISVWYLPESHTLPFMMLGAYAVWSLLLFLGIFLGDVFRGYFSPRVVRESGTPPFDVWNS